MAEVKSWASILEPNTLAQAEMTASMPFVYPHLALMPDAHLGKGATVGSVIPTDGAIIPAAVGVDIGCGMIAVRTQWRKDDVKDAMDFRPLSELREGIERAVPLGAGHNNSVITPTAEWRLRELTEKANAVSLDPDTYLSNWQYQLGTLGSGNHFIEVTVDEEDRVWLFLHSGSRGIGNKIAQYHIRVAQDQCNNAGVSLPDKDLAYLVEDSDEFDHYMRELMWAQQFALYNREEMMDRCIAEFGKYMHGQVDEQERINCHHNFTQVELHYDRALYISRKGAIEAKAGQWGLIPGSMGTASYVVQGLGNPESFMSSPHGAGRNYSRGAAKRTFTQEQLREAMTGIEYRDTPAFIDEIPAAYKDIDQVMRDSVDLVSIRHTLRQIVNVKGE